MMGVFHQYLSDSGEIRTRKSGLDFFPILTLFRVLFFGFPVLYPPKEKKDIKKDQNYTETIFGSLLRGVFLG